MRVETRKSIWWLLLASFGGVALVSLGVLIATISSGFSDGPAGFCCVTVFEVPMAILAWVMLRRCYREQPVPWTGCWQLSLSDLLSVAFFFAFLLTVSHEIVPDEYLRVGLYISIVLGLGYFVSLLVVARAGYSESASERW